VNHELKEIQDKIDSYKKNTNNSVGELSDGYHSFNDLYKHRAILSAIAFMKIPYAWKSKVHDDGTMFDGMFIVGAPTPSGMVTYHYDLEYWNLFKVPTLPHAPHFDGHTPEDVLDRLTKFIETSAFGRLVTDYNISAIEHIVTDQILPVFGDDLVAKGAFIGSYNSSAVF
jgi:hypothetical protein